MVNYTKIAVKGTLTVLVISMVAAFLGYIVRLVLAINLTVEEFGLFNAVFAFLGMIGIFKSLGFDKALIKFIPEFKHENRNDFIKSSIIYVAIVQLITNSIVIIGVYLLSNYLSANFFHSVQADVLLKLMAIAFFVDSFVTVLKFLFQGFKEMVHFSIIDVIRMILVLAIVLVGFRLKYGLLSPTIAYLVTPIILLFIFTPIFLKGVFPEFIKSNLVFDKELIKKISKYSIFVTETTAASLILYYTDILSLTYFSDLKSVGLYSVALPTAKVLMYFPRAIGGMLLPLSAELWIKKQEMLLTEGLKLLYKYSIILIVPLVCIMFSFADLLITVLYGKDYVLASDAMRILSIGMIFAIIYGINVNFFAGIGKPQLTAKITYIAAFFNFITNIILIPFIGILGAALATTLSYFIMMLMGLIEIKKLIKIYYPIKIWVKTLIAGVLFTIMILILKQVISLNIWLETAIVLLISSVSYIALLFLLEVVKISELKELYKRIVK